METANLSWKQFWKPKLFRPLVSFFGGKTKTLSMGNFCKNENKTKQIIWNFPWKINWYFLTGPGINLFPNGHLLLSSQNGQKTWHNEIRTEVYSHSCPLWSLWMQAGWRWVNMFCPTPVYVMSGSRTSLGLYPGNLGVHECGSVILGSLHVSSRKCREGSRLERHGDSKSRRCLWFYPLGCWFNS